MMSQFGSKNRLTTAVAVACLFGPAWMLSGCQNEKDDGNPVIVEDPANTTTPSATPTSTSPSVVVTTPASGARDVELGASVQLIFSEDLLATTVNTSQFTLKNPAGESVDIGVTFDGSKSVTLTPSRPLKALTTYTVNVGTGVTDQSGEALAAAYQWSFTSRDGAWLTAELVEFDNSGAADKPQAAFDGDGNAIVVWQQEDAQGITSIWINRYIIGSGWGAPQLVEDAEMNANDARVTTDADGNAQVVWLQDDGNGNQSLWGRIYKVNTGWDTAVLMEGGENDAESPDLAANAAGQSLTVWAQDDGNGNYSVRARRYDPNNGLATEELVETGTGNASLPQVAIDASGNATVVWAQVETTGSVGIWSSRHIVGNNWTTPSLIESRTLNGSKPQVAVDAEGNAMAVWLQDDGNGTNSVWVNRYRVGTGWGTALLIETGAGDADDPSVTAAADGSFKVVWSQDDTDGTRDIWANSYSPESGWGEAARLENTAGDATLPQVDIDANGNAIAIWQQDDATGNSSIWVARFAADTGWAEPVTIENGNGDANSPYIAVDDEGNGLAVWQQADSDGVSIWANRFTMAPATAADTTPPSVVSTKPLSSSAGEATDVQVELIFSETVQPGPLSYSIKLFKGDVLVPSSVSFNGTNGVVLAPATELDLEARYTVVVSRDVRDIAGNPMANEYAWSFTTRNALWRGEASVQSVAGAAYFSDVAMDSEGNAIAIWTQQDGNAARVWSNTYLPGIGWGTASRIDATDYEYYADTPSIAFDSAGNAVAVWLQDNGTFNYDVWGNVYTAGSGWGAPLKLETAAGGAGEPHLLVQKDGTALVTWAQDLSANNSGIFVVEYDPSKKSATATGWTNPLQVDDGQGVATDPQIAANLNGDRTVAWSQSDANANADVRASRFTAGVGWGAPSTIDSAVGGAREVQVTMDGTGNAIAVWRQDDGDGKTFSIWANRFAVGSGWTADARELESAAGDADDIRVATDAQGNSLALWTQRNAANTYDIWISAYLLGDGWQTPDLVETRDGIAYSIDISVTDDGRLAIVWHQDDGDGTYSIWAATYSEALDKVTTEKIEAGEGDARNPSVGINTDGTAVAVWIQKQEGVDKVLANEFR